MLSSRGGQKYDRVTVTLVPTSDDRSFHSVPTTYSASDRTYQWRKAEAMSYMIVPKRVTSARIEVDVFVDAAKKGRTPAREIQKTVQDFVKSKIESEWKGLRLGTVGRAGTAVPPQKSVVRGSIEDILGVAFDR
ncbi:MAG TPA: hypothetical protein VL221_07025 [Bacteroidota bacterium]|nr:hypothetical protein [Bacteroidota bacterium]